MRNPLTDKIKILRFLLMLLFGLYLHYWMVAKLDEEFIFKGEFWSVMLVVYLGLLMWNNIRDIREYKKTKSKMSFLPSGTGLFLIVMLILTNYLLNRRDSSSVIIQAGTSGGFNGAWFDFREDGTYKFANSGGLGASYFRGTYTIADSIITLDKGEIDGVTKSNLFAIREIRSHGKASKILYQINEKHQIVDKDFFFTVNQDDRKK